ncbi:hydroxyacylglutathione hydrolase [Hyphobacterium sp. SN044]|uniref:hydroxyacylglutathione hydrolase n=1 Tax=Hyphobacterium sp. SN044 TaxID=2912575 RepID=UPI001F01D809|nr:hydroxyacylglutathione hydrolase [Hyphobacterium sp. SN044]MCF8879810.1 hydroxyacylglutathione hydrolase [Hyphobacterium sp. SN044]
MASLLVRQFPCLQDNYGFLVHDPESGETAAIDTPDAPRIKAEADKAGWRITQIWNTHHHWDHAGGNAALKEMTGARIVAPSYDRARIEGIDVEVSDGDTVSLGTKTAQVFFTPGHTLGHVIYWFEEDAVAFVGDTLFALGCGRLFEGSPEQMWSSLSRLAALPEKTAVYCAHEYTQSNARFALSVEPDHAALKAYAGEVETLRARGEPTVPTTIGREKAANPFLRAADPDLRRALNMPAASDAEVFAEVRRRKDNF